MIGLSFHRDDSWSVQLVPAGSSTRSHRAGSVGSAGCFAVAVACTRQLDGHRGIALFRCGRHHHAGGLFPDRLATGFPPRVCGAGDIARPRGRVHVPRGWSMKIGFLALSGIRAHDPELLALGLTLPALSAAASDRIAPSCPSVSRRLHPGCHDSNTSRPRLTHDRRCYRAISGLSTSAQDSSGYAIARRCARPGSALPWAGARYRPAEGSAAVADYGCRRGRARVACRRRSRGSTGSAAHLPCGGISIRRCGASARAPV